MLEKKTAKEDRNAMTDLNDFKAIIKSKIASGEIMEVAESMDLKVLKQLVASLSELCDSREKRALK
jgi:hypothetical protein